MGHPLFGELDVAAAGVEAEAAGGVGGDLEGRGTLHVAVGGAGDGEQVVCADVGDNEFVVGDKANAVDAGRDRKSVV